MMNSCMCYKRYCGLKGVPVQWTHHDWNQAIRHAHLDHYKDWLWKKKSPEKMAEAMNKTFSEKESSPKVESKALSPTWGQLKI